MAILEQIRAKAENFKEQQNDKLSKSSHMTASQVKELKEKREKYLEGKLDPANDMAKEKTRRQLAAVGTEIYETYLPFLSSIYLPIENSQPFAPSRIAYFKITKWARCSEDDNIEKLMNVYQVLDREACNIALIYHRTVCECQVYMAVLNDSENSDESRTKHYAERLLSALKGNFPGADIEIEGDKEKKNEVKFGVLPSLSEENIKDCSVAAVSNLAADKTEKFAGQTIEKVLDGIVPANDNQAYTLILLGTPARDQFARKNRLYELYSALTPFAAWQTNYTATDMTALQSGASNGVSLGANASANFNIGVPGIAGGGVSAGVSAGVNFGHSASTSVTLGKNEGLTQNYTNYEIKHTLDVLEGQMKRLEQCSALGLWEFAAYVISPNSVVANNVACTYRALTQGEESYMSESAVNLWRGDVSNESNNGAQCIIRELSRLHHPEFALKDNISEEQMAYPVTVTATVSLSGKELARALNFPGRSVSGFPVLETAAFGRNISSYNKIDQDLKLGKIYHMHQAEETDVKLSKKSLTSHVFVTGSTGAGKTNTVVTLLKNAALNSQGTTHFLVVEPAKGEYRDLIGGYDKVTVYSTNPNVSKLLRINPFSFPKNITVSEHIDRLVEIFNVCWPMYAAMPAILKDAVIRAYEAAGWDVARSECVDPPIYPGFLDVMEQVKNILNSSEYSSDTKGDYVGALVARLKSLTDGINGQIFSSDALTDADLFDKNVIVDMSRVGATETKSLIMGLLVMKLQEYRLSEEKPDIKELKHITVLEEAHNLLRRTSTEQSSESSNLLGKSVEMLTNAIAELRAFGEGFIIADQAPALLDMAVIRNTNTKIVHRIPDQSDRELVGRAMGMTDSQIFELSRLELGVAAVYQNEWIEPILCKVSEFKQEEKKSNSEKGKLALAADYVQKNLLEYLLTKDRLGKGSSNELDQLGNLAMKSNLRAAVKRSIRAYQNCTEKDRVPIFRKLIYELTEGKKLMDDIDPRTPASNMVDRLNTRLKPMLGDFPEHIDLVVKMLIYEQQERNPEYEAAFCELEALCKAERLVNPR